MMNYEANIGRRVHKPISKKPFKSGLLINVVKGVINHPILNIPAYVFEEDDSYVECRRCALVDTHEVVDLVYHDEEGNIAFQGTFEECQNWKSEQGLGYQVRPIIWNHEN